MLTSANRGVAIFAQSLALNCVLSAAFVQFSPCASSLVNGFGKAAYSGELHR
jgi:hypothetical protein